MQTQLQVTWEGLDPSDFILRRIEREVGRLERTFGRIVSCKVVVEGRSRRHHKGGLYALRTHLLLPGGIEIEANRNPPEDHAHEDAYVAVRDVFEALRRQLRERVRERRQQARHAETQPHGVVSKLIADKECGFLRSDDGREIYFHKNAVLTGYEELREGMEVHFVEEEGRDGPQASTVRAFGVR
jgi:cold shock CspA family protein